MIGLATPYLTNNYGTKLQAFALQSFFNINNIENEIIDYRFNGKIYDIRKIFLSNRKQYKDVHEKRKAALACNQAYKVGYDTRNKCFKEFVEKRLMLSAPCSNLNEVAKLAEGRYSAVVCGSDQIWLPSHAIEKYYLLNFLPKSLKKIAYAPSFGVSEIPSLVKSDYKKAIADFDTVTTRENRGKEIVKELTGRECSVVVDPTLLLTAEEWESLLGICQPVYKKKYVFSYFIGSSIEHRQFAKKFSDSIGAKLIILPNVSEVVPADLEYSDYAPYDVGPSEFVNLIKNAEAVFTDSFHGTVFSLIFGKNFYSFERFKSNSKASTNSRIYSLLKNTNLENRLIRKYDEIVTNEQAINYDEVHGLINDMRQNSINIIREAVK